VVGAAIAAFYNQYILRADAIKALWLLQEQRLLLSFLISGARQAKIATSKCVEAVAT
jgi:hypothetical protein